MRIPNKYKTLAGNTGLLFVGTFGSKMISFVMLPFYTSWLSIEDFGTSDIINVYSTILVAIVSLCIAEAVFVIPTGRNFDDQKKLFSSSLVFGLASASVLVLLYYLVHIIGRNLSFSFFTNIGYITLLCGTTIYTSIAQQFCKCINKIRIFAFAGIINTLCVAALGFILIKPLGLIGYVESLVIANVFTFCYVMFHAKLYKYITISAVSKDYLRELLKFSIPLVPNSVIWLIVSYINRPIMEAYMGITAIGLLSLANRFPTLIATLYNNFSNSWQISVLQEYGKEGYEKFYNRTCLGVFCGMCFCVSLMALVIEPLIHLFFNENYYPVIDYIPWLCLSTPFMALASIVGANFSAIKQSKYFFYSSIWSAVSALIFNAILIPFIGFWGVCIASVMSFFVGAITRIYYAEKYVKLKNNIMYVLFSIITIACLLISHFSQSSIWSFLIILLQLGAIIFYPRFDHY